MKKCLIPFIILTFLFTKFNSDYILPLSIVNIGINQTLLEEDFLSNILSRHLCADFIIGSYKEKIRAVINMSQIGFFIYDQSYDYLSSSTFKYTGKIRSFYYKNSEEGYDANDTLCFMEYEKNKKLDYYDITRCKEFKSVNYELLKSRGDNNETSNYANYGVIGLQMHSNQDEFLLSTFIKALKDTDMIDSHYFSFNFINKQKNDDYEGYLYIGEEEMDEDKGRKTKVGSFPISGQLFWNLKFQNIHSAVYNESNSSIYTNYKEFDTKIAQLIVDFPFIIAVNSYKSYIRADFFQKLEHENICQIRKIKLDEDYSTYVCDNTSKLFREKFEKEFPKLSFQHDELNKTFIFDQNDLFTYNYLNKSDHNIYFLILFSDKKGKYNPYNPSQNEIPRWRLGIPFFKKYKLVLNADNHLITYYEIFKSDNNDKNGNSNGNGNSDENSNKKLYLILEIGGAVLLLIIVFVLGFLCHKNIITLPRKKKANELDDDYEYSINPNEFDEKKASLNNYEVHN